MNSTKDTGKYRAVAIAGPSGVGKSTLLGRLLKEHPDKFGFSVSHTTRSPRPGEKNGVNYWFVSREQMQKEIQEGKFIEWAEFSGNIYGTSHKAVEDVLATGKICLLDVDMQGIISLKKTTLNPIYCMIVPPSKEELEKRLRGRGDTAEEAIQKRLKQAEWELSFRSKPGFFDYVVVNDNVEVAYNQLKGICMQGGKL